MSNNPYELGPLDKKIITLMQDDPRITTEEISEVVGKSKAIVGNRILKLERKGILSNEIGINMTTANAVMAIVEISARSSSKVLENMQQCPLVVNAFRKTGNSSITAIFAADKLSSLDNFINRCFRGNPLIKKIETNYVLDTMHKFVVPLNLEINKITQFGCPLKCGMKHSEEQQLKSLIDQKKQDPVSAEYTSSIDAESAIEAH